MTARMCAREGCGRPSRALGWCDTHYRQARKAPADPDPGPYPKPPVTAACCGDCGQTVGYVSTQDGVWGALAAHTCPVRKGTARVVPS